jgi:hypothetical protein
LPARPCCVLTTLLKTFLSRRSCWSGHPTRLLRSLTSGAEILVFPHYEVPRRHEGTNMRSLGMARRGKRPML